MDIYRLPIGEKLKYYSKKTNEWAKGIPRRFENHGAKKQLFDLKCVCGHKKEIRDVWGIYECENCGNYIYFGEPK